MLRSFASVRGNIWRAHIRLPLRFYCKRRQFNFFHPQNANITQMNTSNFVCIKVLLNITIALRRFVHWSQQERAGFQASARNRLKERWSRLCFDMTPASLADNTWPFVIEGNLAFSILWKQTSPIYWNTQDANICLHQYPFKDKTGRYMSRARMQKTTQHFVQDS